MGNTIRQSIYQFLEWIKPYDLLIFKKINQEWTAKWADQFMPLVTDLHKTGWFFYFLPVVILLLVGKKYKSHAVTILVGLCLCIAVCDWAGGKVKRTIPRARPFQEQVLKETGAIQKSPAAANTSFYSNHASNNFAVATFMSLFMPVLSWLFFPIAFIIGYSRIYNGVHFPSDVIIGALLGIIWGRALGHFTFRFITYELHKKSLKEDLEQQKSGLSKSLHPGKR